MASRKLPRAIQHQVEPATCRLQGKSLLQPDYGDSVPAQHFHDTGVARHLGARTRAIADIRTRNPNDEIRTARQESAVLQQRIPEHRRRRQYPQAIERPHLRPLAGQGQ